MSAFSLPFGHCESTTALVDLWRRVLEGADMGRSMTRTCRLARAALALTLTTGAVLSFGSAAGAATSLAVVATPSPAGPPNVTFSEVSCASATLCFAIGQSNSGALIEEFNGTAWSSSPIATPTGSTGMTLEDISCPSVTSCFAVGSFFQPNPDAELTLVE